MIMMLTILFKFSLHVSPVVNFWEFIEPDIYINLWTLNLIRQMKLTQRNNVFKPLKWLYYSKYTRPLL